MSDSHPAPKNPGATARLATAWAALQPRERRGLALAAAVVGLALLVAWGWRRRWPRCAPRPPSAPRCRPRPSRCSAGSARPRPCRPSRA
ncbi:MAG: hypothetical protein M9943_08855 [Burkholderiaceae bacterium]|nr:hypothetical protein [Burkholderiaceae bacterium]